MLAQLVGVEFNPEMVHGEFEMTILFGRLIEIEIWRRLAPSSTNHMGHFAWHRGPN